MLEQELKEPQVDQPEKPKVDAPEKKPDSSIAMYTLGGRAQAKLAGVDAYVNVIQLGDYGLVDRTGTKLTDVEQHTADAAGDIDDPEAIKKIEEQLDASRLEGEALKVLSQIFREFGSQDVFVADAGPDGGAAFDTAKMGHKMDFGDATTFVVPEDRKDELKGLLQEPVSTAASEQSEQFNMDLRWQFLDDDQGVRVKYNIGGREEEIVFLFAERQSQEAQNNDEEEKEDTQMAA